MSGMTQGFGILCAQIFISVFLQMFYLKQNTAIGQYSTESKYFAPRQRFLPSLSEVTASASDMVRALGTVGFPPLCCPRL